MRVRKLQERRGWAYTVAVAILKPLLTLATRRRWVDPEKIPAEGGFVLVLNHISHIDPLTAAHLVYDSGRLPRYLAKDALFRNRWLGGFLKSAGQIPVYRLSERAVGAYDAAVAAVEQGKCVVVYPEGTITRDPGLWPMRGKSGAARIALATGCPVIPVGQWGAHEVLPPYTTRPHLVPRRTIAMKVGDPVDLSDLVGQEPTPALVARASDRIMAAVAGLVADLRGEPAPAERYDPRTTGVRPIGNPNPRQRRNQRRRDGRR